MGAREGENIIIKYTHTESEGASKLYEGGNFCLDFAMEQEKEEMGQSKRT